MESSEIPNIPEPILLNILTRLPIKSIVRFKSTCKQWRDLISSHHFVRTHLTRSSPHHRLAILDSRDPPSSLAIRSIDFEKPPNYADHHSQSIELHSNFKYSYPHAKILCSMDGLLLISISEKTLFVWNPSIRDYKHVRCPYFAHSVHMIGGIGYDCLVHEYKLVMVHQVRKHGCHKTRVNCFSLESRFTRFINVNFPYRILQDSPGIVVDGCPHWIVTREIVNFPVIIRFDFAQEVFVELEQPDCLFDDSEPIKFDLGVLGGLLSLVCHKTCHVEIRVMQRDGVFESWLYLYMIPFSPELPDFRHIMPLGYTESGEVLMEFDRKKLVAYKFDEGTYRFVQFSHNDSGFKVAVFVESLVSPHGNYGSSAPSN